MRGELSLHEVREEQDTLAVRIENAHGHNSGMNGLYRKMPKDIHGRAAYALEEPVHDQFYLYWQAVQEQWVISKKLEEQVPNCGNEGVVGSLPWLWSAARSCFVECWLFGSRWQIQWFFEKLVSRFAGS